MIKIYIDKIRIEDKDISSYPESIKNHLIKYCNHHRYYASLSGWSLLLNVLANEYNIPNPEISFSETGKPLCDQVHFSISHSENIVVVGVSLHNIGVDLECQKNIRRVHKLKKYLHTESNHYKSLLKAWTVKEAIIKYYGEIKKNETQNYVESKFLYFDEEVYCLSVCSEKRQNIIYKTLFK